MSGMLHYTDAEYLDETQLPEWEFSHGCRRRDGEITVLAAHHPEAGTYQRLCEGNFVWHTRELASKQGMRLRETRRGRVDELRELEGGQYVALVDFGAELARADAREIAVSGSSEGGAWEVCYPPEGVDAGARTQTEWVDVQEEAEVPEPESTSELSFERIQGRGSRKEVNAFLEGYQDGTVSHECGGVHHWKAAFVARYEGHIIGALVLAPHQNGAISSAKEELVISRVACHPSRPKNTSSWMVSRACKWAERKGYSRLSALAGVGGNRGRSTYKGAAFELEEREEGYQDGEGNRWVKHRWVRELEPEKYEGRDVPLPGEPASTATA